MRQLAVRSGHVQLPSTWCGRMNHSIRIVAVAATLFAAGACGRGVERTRESPSSVSPNEGPADSSSPGLSPVGDSGTSDAGTAASGSQGANSGTTHQASGGSSATGNPSPDGGAAASALGCTTDASDPALPKVTAQFNPVCADMGFREPGCHVSRNACISGNVAFAAPASGNGTVPLGSWDSRGNSPYTDWWIDYTSLSPPRGIFVGSTVWGTDFGFVADLWDLSARYNHHLSFYASNGTPLHTIVAEDGYFVRHDGVVAARRNPTATGYALVLNYHSARGEFLVSSSVDSTSAPIPWVAVAQTPTRHVLVMYLVESASAPATMMARWFDGEGRPLTISFHPRISSCGDAFPTLQAMTNGDVALAVMTAPNGRWTYCAVIPADSPDDAIPPAWLAQESNLFQLVRGDTMYSFSIVMRGAEDVRIVRDDGVECARYGFANIDTEYSGIQIGVDGTVDSLEGSNPCQSVWWPALLGR